MILKKLPLPIIFVFLGLYFLSTGVSFAVFSYFKTPAKVEQLIAPIKTDIQSKFNIDPNAPKTETCPLTGKKYTLKEKEIWEKSRPLTVMIENHQDSRPQSGLSKSDVVYEAVAEGGITRFLAVFYCDSAAYEITIGPVRSARIYYLDFAQEYGDYPLYTHVGGGNDFDGSGKTHKEARALEKIASLGWRLYNDLDQSSIGFPYFWRDYERLGHPVATEHTVYTTNLKLLKVAEERGLTNVDKDGVSWNKNFIPWQFKEDAQEAQRGNKSPVFNFWSGYGEYEVKWEYDPTTNSYKRINGGQPQKDRNNEETIAVKNVVVQFTVERGPVDENKHLLYQTTGSGKALIFQDGNVIKANWTKKESKSRTKYQDEKGKEITFNPGRVWIEIVPAGKEVVY
jgi:hypothetical protein